MSAIGQPTSANFTASEAAGRLGDQSDAFTDLDLNGFLQLIISELQNQDPLNPTDNAQLLEQLGQIRSIGATDQLSNTLETLASSQELVTASSLIGQTVSGLGDDAAEVNGVVDRISVETDPENGTRSIKVQVGERTIDINNIREIQPG